MVHSLSFFLLDNMADTQYLIRELLKIKDSVAQRCSIIKKQWNVNLWKEVKSIEFKMVPSYFDALHRYNDTSSFKIIFLVFEITITSFPSYGLFSPYIASPFVLFNHGHFFFINGCYINYVIGIFIYTPRHVSAVCSCLCVIRAGHLVFDNQLVYSS